MTVRLVSPLIASACPFLCLFLVGMTTAYGQSPGCLEQDRGDIAKALGAPHLADILSLETADCDGLSLAEGGVGFRLGDRSAPVYGGIRSEVALDYPFVEGDVVKYAWEMKFPTGFAGDGPLNRWWLVAQWHDQPDRRKGEKWAGFAGRSPPVAIYVETRDGVPGIGVVLSGRDKRSWAPIPRGDWLRVSTTVRWSSHDDGEVVFEVAGHPEFNARIAGRNMHNSFQHYLKLGQYRHPKIVQNTEVFFRSLRIDTETYRTPTRKIDS